MIKRSLVLLILLCSFFLISTSTVLADHKKGRVECTDERNRGEPNGHCVEGYSCQASQAKPNKYLCQPAPFGQIKPPDPLQPFITKNPTGALGISQFLSNLIALFYTVAAIVLIFMLLWGAFEWMTSGGDKEKIEAARRRIISAIIGMILFAVAFAVIQILGQFTGFKFFGP